jgi:hypothetical protein
MSATSALYYPHTKIADKNLIKNSLLLWDQLEYITPSSTWTHERFDSKVFNEAIDLISKPHFPTQAERNEAHAKIQALIKRGLPEWFFLDAFKNVRNPNLYGIYPDKLSAETWRLLEENFLVRFNRIDSDYYSSPYFGLTIMSLLADSIAGEKKRKITDRSEAYGWLQQYTTSQLGGQYIKNLDVSQVAPDHDRLITLSIKMLNTDDISVKSLVDMRKRELKSSSADYRKFRISYLNKVDKYVDEISKLSRESDIKEVERQFELDMADDLKDLRQELNLTKRQLIFSKELGVAVLATIGSLATCISGLTDLATYLDAVGVGALIRTGLKYKADKKKVLRSNSMSWLYLTDKRAKRFNPKKILI